MRNSGSSSGLLKAVYVVGFCLVIIGVVGTGLYSIPERKTVTLTIPGTSYGGNIVSGQIRLDGRYSCHISGSYSFQKNFTISEFSGPLPNFEIYAQEGLNADYAHRIPVFLSSEPRMNFSLNLPVSQTYYINASYLPLGPTTAISVVIHYDVSGAKVDYARTFITVLAGGIFLLSGGGILRRMYPMTPNRMAGAPSD
jgi:hypothetical protein